MDNPRELVRRAARSRSAAAQAAAGASQAREPQTQPVRTQAREPQPQPVRTQAQAAPPRGGHAAYTDLMRSHDRVRTRHLPVQAGNGRA